MAGISVEELRRRRDDAFRVADLVELRLDAMERPDVAGALEGAKGPVLVTCRPRWEGGWFDGPEEARLSILREAAGLGAAYVDVEWRSDYAPVMGVRGGRGIVLSMHDFGGTPADLADCHRAMRASGAEVVKLAVAAHALTDCLALAALGRQAARDRERLALVAMGPSGLPTRVLPERFGSVWSYAGEGLAPGQVGAERLLAEFRFRETTSRTTVYGVAGRPVGHSLSPSMHNAAFRATGVDAVYLPLEARDADDLLRFAAAFGLAGASVTAPLKQDLLASVDQSDATSRRIGALNTLRWTAGRCEGANTDVAGFMAPLANEPVRNARAAVIGTGGAARAAVDALASLGARVTVYGRQLDRASAVAELAGGEGRAGSPERATWDLLVNATPVGSFPEVSATPLAEDGLRGGRLVYDLVSNPAQTRLLREAAAAGCRTIGGLEMLVAQAALQFRWWTGLSAPVALMRDAARARLAAVTATE